MHETYKERLVAGLLATGWVEDVIDRSKYNAFRHPNQTQKLFVGPNGALRAGPCASKSWSVGDATRQSNTYKNILAAGDAVLPTSSVNKQARKDAETALLAELRAL